MCVLKKEISWYKMWVILLVIKLITVVYTGFRTEFFCLEGRKV